MSEQAVYEVTFISSAESFEVTMHVRTEGAAMDAIRQAVHEADCYKLKAGLAYVTDVKVRREL